MTGFIQKHRRWLLMLPVALAAIVLAIALRAVTQRQAAGAAPEEITLVAKDVAFRLADHPNEPNPSLQLKRGRAVKLIIRNDEPGKVLHCFTIGGLDVGTSRDLATGESEALTFTPRETGTFA